MPHHIYQICNKETKDSYLFWDDSKRASEYALNLATKQKHDPKNIEISIYRKRQNSSQLVKDYSFLLTDTVDAWTNRQKLEEKMTIVTNQMLRQHFKNFVADFKRFEDIVFIDWHNVNGNCKNQVNYMINEKTGELHISGDLGSAIFYWCYEITWQNIANCSEDLGYFLSKAEANSEEGYYDEAKARKELEEYFSKENWDNRDIKEELGCTRAELIDRAMERWNKYGTGEFSNEAFDDDRTVEFLHDNDIYSSGHTVSTRERLWAIGLQMILENYGSNQEQKMTETTTEEKLRKQLTVATEAMYKTQIKTLDLDSAVEMEAISASEAFDVLADYVIETDKNAVMVMETIEKEYGR